MTGRPRLDELFSLACWEPCEEAEAAAILDTLEAEVAELRRILYAAIDPESGAQTAQAVRDLIQGEFNTVATTRKEVNERESGRGPQTVPRSAVPPSIRKDDGCSRSLTSFGADDWATVEDAVGLYEDATADTQRAVAAARAALARLRAAATGANLPLVDLVRASRQRAEVRRGADDWATVLRALNLTGCVSRLAHESYWRLRAADQAKEEALEHAIELCAWESSTKAEIFACLTGGRCSVCGIEHPDALAAAAAAPKETP